MMKKKILFWRRFLSTTIDLSLIYAISIILQFLVWQFYFISFGWLFVTAFITYYIASYFIWDGKTPAKVLTGLQVVKKSGNKIHIQNIFFREIIFKGLLILVLPLFIYDKLIPLVIYKRILQSPIVLYTAYSSAFILILSVLILLIFKTSWWDYFSNTRCIKSKPTSIKELKYAIYSISLILLASIVIILYPFVSGKANLQYSFYPKYPINGETKSYAEFIKHNAKNPIDYVFDLFDKYDFVVLSEREHDEYTQYNLITKIVSDKRFITNVGNIFTECGSVSFQDTLDTYLNTRFLNEDELNKSTAILQRNSNGVWPLWSCTNLFDFLKTVNKLNSTLSDSQKIHWYFTDLAVNWDTMTAQGFQQHYTGPGRDSIMAAHIIQDYDDFVSKQKRKKALVIMNDGHGYGLLKNIFESDIKLGFNRSTTAYLMKNFPNRVANVMLNFVSLKYWMMFTPIQHGKWDAAFSIVGNPDVGFDFAHSPFGNDDFDAFIKTPSNLKYKDVFTGFIFYKPLEEQIQKEGFPYEFDNFESTILKRAACVDNQYVEMIKRNIKIYKSDPSNPISTENTNYAVLYNIVNVVFAPFLMLLIIIISLILFIYSRKHFLLNNGVSK